MKNTYESHMILVLLFARKQWKCIPVDKIHIEYKCRKLFYPSKNVREDVFPMWQLNSSTDVELKWKTIYECQLFLNFWIHDKKLAGDLRTPSYILMHK